MWFYLNACCPVMLLFRQSLSSRHRLTGIETDIQVAERVYLSLAKHPVVIHTQVEHRREDRLDRKIAFELQLLLVAHIWCLSLLSALDLTNTIMIQPEHFGLSSPCQANGRHNQAQELAHRKRIACTALDL